MIASRDAVEIPPGKRFHRATGRDYVAAPESQVGWYLSTHRAEVEVYASKARDPDPGGPWIYAFGSDRPLRLLRIDAGPDHARVSDKRTAPAFLREVAEAGYDGVIYGEDGEHTNGRPWDHVIMARDGLLAMAAREPWKRPEPWPEPEETPAFGM